LTQSEAPAIVIEDAVTTRRSTAMDKKIYSEPKVTDFGTVADLTQSGRTMPGSDAKGGSAMSTGG
jgi:hypothetical protein